MPVLDVTPLHAVTTGVLIGDVADADRLGFEEGPYPRMESGLTISELSYQPDGRMTVSPACARTRYR
jgi:hypothetical protein